ncbi:hypothetical protein HHX47_DHR6000005 [Lentinula edodes]|nr:hypothetical protein HHX47_DHR6000005 [Lentinula edodes]
MIAFNARFTLLAALLSLIAVSLNPLVEAAAISARRPDTSSSASGTHHKTTREPVLPLPTRSEKALSSKKSEKGEKKKKEGSSKGHKHDGRALDEFIQVSPWDHTHNVISVNIEHRDELRVLPGHHDHDDGHRNDLVDIDIKKRGEQAHFHTRRHSEFHDGKVIIGGKNDHVHIHARRHHDHDHDKVVVKGDNDHVHIHGRDHDHDHDHNHDHDHDHDHRRARRFRPHPRSLETMQKRACQATPGYIDINSDGKRLASMAYNQTMQEYDVSESEASTFNLMNCGTSEASSLVTLACNDIPQGGCLTYMYNGTSEDMTCQRCVDQSSVPPTACQTFMYNITSGQVNPTNCNMVATQADDADTEPNTGDGPDAGDEIPDGEGEEPNAEQAASINARDASSTNSSSVTPVSLVFRPLAKELEVEDTGSNNTSFNSTNTSGNSTSFNATSIDSDPDSTSPNNTSTTSANQTFTTTITVTSTSTSTGSSSSAVQSAAVASPSTTGMKVEVFNDPNETNAPPFSSSTDSPLSSTMTSSSANTTPTSSMMDADAVASSIAASSSTDMMAASFTTSSSSTGTSSVSASTSSSSSNSPSATAAAAGLNARSTEPYLWQFKRFDQD